MIGYTNDYPEFINDLEKVVNLFENGTYEYIQGIEQEIWELARQSENIPHIGNIYTSLVLNRLDDYIKEYLPELELHTYVDVSAMASDYTVNNGTVENLDELIENLKEANEEKHDKRTKIYKICEQKIEALANCNISLAA